MVITDDNRKRVDVFMSLRVLKITIRINYLVVKVKTLEN